MEEFYLGARGKEQGARSKRKHHFSQKSYSLAPRSLPLAPIFLGYYLVHSFFFGTFATDNDTTT